MLEHINEKKILFLDIETVPIVKDYNDLSESMQKLWDKKSTYFRDENQAADQVFQKAGIYAEFGKIVCISVGFLTESNHGKTLRIKTFSGDDEKKVLADFNNLVDTHFAKDDCFLCAHNGKEFDFPYIARRSLVNGIALPKQLDTAGKKPWEVKHLDTLELWKFGDYKHYTSLNLLTEIFNIPTPKDDINGEDVAHVYWEDNNLERIVAYCQKDVLAIVQLYMRYVGKPLIDEEQIEIINP